jgi:hypothetical protein
MKIRNEFVQNLFKKWRNEAGRSYCFDCLRRSKWWEILAPKRLSMLHPHGRDKAQHIKFEEKILKLRLDSKSSFQVQLLSLRQLQADFSISTKALFPVSNVTSPATKLRDAWARSMLVHCFKQIEENTAEKAVPSNTPCRTSQQAWP